MKKTMKYIWNSVAILSIVLLILSAALPGLPGQIFPFSMRIVGHLEIDSTLTVGDTTFIESPIMYGDSIMFKNWGTELAWSDVPKSTFGDYTNGTYTRWNNALNRIGFFAGNFEKLQLDTVGIYLRDTTIYVNAPTRSATAGIIGISNDTLYEIPYPSGASGLTQINNGSYRMVVSDNNADTIKGLEDLTYNQGNLEINYDGGGASLFEIKSYISGTPSPGIMTYGFNGTKSSYAAVQNNDVLGYWWAAGSESASGTNNGMEILITANQTWTSGSHGTKFSLELADDNGGNSGEPWLHLAVEDSVTSIYYILELAPLAAAPSTPREGWIYVNSTSNHIYCYLHGSWVQLDN